MKPHSSNRLRWSATYALCSRKTFGFFSLRRLGEPKEGKGFGYGMMLDLFQNARGEQQASVDFGMLDPRGEYGDPADDVTCIALNYVSFSLRRTNSDNRCLMTLRLIVS